MFFIVPPEYYLLFIKECSKSEFKLLVVRGFFVKVITHSILIGPTGEIHLKPAP
jgi:hypothetical protein